MKFRPVQFFFIFIIVLVLHILVFERIFPLLQAQSLSQTHTYQKIQISFVQEQKEIIKKNLEKPEEHPSVEKLPCPIEEEIKINKQKTLPIKTTKLVSAKEKKRDVQKKLKNREKAVEKRENKAVTKEQVSKITEQKKAQTNKIDTHISLADEEKIVNSYIQYVYQTIDSHKFYPKMAKRMGVEGKCKLGFKILCDGSVKEVKILEKSSFTALNSAALEIIEKIGKFHAFPDSLEKKEITLEVPIEYSLKGEK